jgi:hypothetical protein
MELLLALLMTAVLAGGLWQALWSGRTAQARAERTARLNQIGRAVLEILRRDLEGIVVETSPFNEGLYGASDDTTEFPADSISFLSCASFPLITSSRTVNFEAADRPIETDLLQVQYAVGGEDEAGLIRRTKKCLTCTLYDDSAVWEEENLAFEVVGLNLRYWNGSEWLDAWDSLETESYPEAIEVAVVVGLVERSEGEVVLYDEDGNLVQTAVFRTAVTVHARPQNKAGAQGPMSGIVR